MLAFLQAYGWWFVFGALILLMFRMHGGGMRSGDHSGGYGCGMGHSDHMDQHGNMEDHVGHQEGSTLDSSPETSARRNGEWAGNVVESTLSYNHRTPVSVQEKNHDDF